MKKRLNFSKLKALDAMILDMMTMIMRIRARLITKLEAAYTLMGSLKSSKRLVIVM